MRPAGERPIVEVIAENVEKYRKESGMSVQELAVKADYSYQSYMKLIKNDVELRPSTLQRIAYVLKVKTIDLVEDWG